MTLFACCFRGTNRQAEANSAATLQPISHPEEELTDLGDIEKRNVSITASKKHTAPRPSDVQEPTVPSSANFAASPFFAPQPDLQTADTTENNHHVNHQPSQQQTSNSEPVDVQLIRRPSYNAAIVPKHSPSQASSTLAGAIPSDSPHAALVSDSGYLPASEVSATSSSALTAESADLQGSSRESTARASSSLTLDRAALDGPTVRQDVREASAAVGISQEAVAQHQQPTGAPDATAGVLAPEPAPEPNPLPYPGAPFCTAGERLRCANFHCMLLDKEKRDPYLDSVTSMLGRLLGFPICIVDFIDHEKLYIKSNMGWDLGLTGDRRFSICTWTFIPLKPEVLVVPDTSKDGRLMSHPVVVDPSIGLRAYVGVPLVTNTGQRLGTLCVLDYKPRSFSAAACNLMINFADLVVSHFERQKLQTSGKGTAEMLLTANECAAPVSPTATAHEALLSSVPVAMPRGGPANCKLRQRKLGARRFVAMVNAKDPAWPLLYATEEWLRVFGLQPDAAYQGTSFWDIVRPVRDRRLDSYKRLAQQSVKFPMLAVPAYKQGIKDGQTDGTDTVCVNMRPVTVCKALEDGPDIIVSLSSAHSASSLPPPPEVDGLYFAVLTQPSNRQLAHDTVVPELFRCPIEDVQLGLLLGQGSHGRVYRGLIGDLPVAVKVISHSNMDGRTTTASATRLRSGLEALIGMRLSHQHVVQHLDFAVVSGSPLMINQDMLNAAGLHVTTSANPSQGYSMRSAFANDSLDDASSTTFSTDSSAVEGVQEWNTWIIMEHCTRGSLQSAIDRGSFRSEVSVFAGGPQMSLVLEVAIQIASAMTYLHAQDVVHGDLCPRNVLLTDPPPGAASSIWAKVADFGLARELHHSTDIQTSTHGTVTHMPLETLLQGVVGKATDVYSFGVMLYELYVTRRPYAGCNAVQVFAMKLLHKVKLEFPQSTPAKYKDLAERCMGPAEQRPTFEEVLSALKAMQETMAGFRQKSFPAWEDPESEQAAAQKWDLGSIRAQHETVADVLVDATRGGKS